MDLLKRQDYRVLTYIEGGVVNDNLVPGKSFGMSRIDFIALSTSRPTLKL